MEFAEVLSRELGWSLQGTTQAVKLLEEGNTIPFIARYRKEATGEMDEVMLRRLAERLEYLKNLTKRQEEIVRLIAEQEKLTPEIQEKINKAVSLQQLEDIYRPFRPKRRTRAGIAREKGLEPLAQLVLEPGLSPQEMLARAEDYVNPEVGVQTPEEALDGACDIIAEQVADDPGVREVARKFFYARGELEITGASTEPTSYEMYYDYREAVRTIPAHRVLAINRGEKEEILQVRMRIPEEEIIKAVLRQLAGGENPTNTYLQKCVSDGAHRLLFPSLEREVRKDLAEKAEAQAIKVFAKNLGNLLLQQPVRGHKVLGIDPGYRTGCKLAVVDDTGRLLETGVIYPHPPQNMKEDALQTLHDIIKKYEVTAIAIGNGTASRETEVLVAQLIREQSLPVGYTIVSEAGASVYSASTLAAKEFPQLDLSYRSGVSIARRLQDPLAELVKIDPRSIGVGQYQHDVNPKELSKALGDVVESCVNSVGVELNTASPSLLQYVAGLNSTVAQAIVARREKLGKYRTRKELLEVPRLGPQTFQQCAGFIRISGGDNPLENTPVHPESYELATRLLAKAGFEKEDLPGKEQEICRALEGINLTETAKELGAGLPTLRDIVEALKKPGRDPREDLPPVLFRHDVLSMEDLREGMVLMGTVRNVVDFGAFVDIGVKQDGLVHLSQLSERYVKHPMEVVAVGDVVKVAVLSVDKVRGRISLTMRGVN